MGFQGSRQLPTQHISIRVPWHNEGWNGSVCQRPRDNASCVQLGRIGEYRDDAAESTLGGESWHHLEEAQLPPCVRERAGFMAPFDMSITVDHPYKKRFKSHHHFGPTRLHMPAYAALTIPYRWMLREQAQEFASDLAIDYQPDHEAKIDELLGAAEQEWSPAWVQDRRNHLVLLDTFFSAIRPQQSLCFFYAKASPLTQDPRRLLLGIGRVTDVGPSTEYDYVSIGQIRSMLWERAIHHSVRPDFNDGFLFPYHDLYQRLSEVARGGDDIDRYLCLVPAEHTDAFSYASEHVSHDVAIAMLLRSLEVLEAISEVVPGPLGTARDWVSDRLGELWTMRGPYPGLGSALAAFSVQTPTLVAYSIQELITESDDPWRVVDELMRNPEGFDLGEAVEPTLRQAWVNLPEERRGLLQLLARFDLTRDQATRFYRNAEREAAGIHAADQELLANPYRLYELDRLCADPISVHSIDRGLFSEAAEEAPYVPTGPNDPRRARALVIARLEEAADQGHTLLARSMVATEMNALAIQPRLAVTEDTMPILEADFMPEVSIASMADAAPAYQLTRLAEEGSVIRTKVDRRVSGKRLAVEADWKALLDTALNDVGADEDEDRARHEKAVALEELAASRFSVLIGPAGTGKTTLLSVLCEHPTIRGGDVLLLAPTGKARVQLEARTGIRAQTLAAFLLQHKRYDTQTGRYLRIQGDKVEGAKTVILDEASMLTEEQLAATMDALRGVDRMILVGDPRQLPPIGHGRPFVDIVNHLMPENVESRFPRVGRGYCELTVPRRQVQGGIRKDADDLLLASWFSGRDPGPGADEIWDRISGGLETQSLRLVAWSNVDDLREKLIEVLVQELELDHDEDLDGFSRALGAVEHNGYLYFNATRGDNRGAALVAEEWQILSPLRSASPGTIDMNRLLQERFRSDALDFAWGRLKRIPRPAGPERIVYGDKVINVTNKRRWDVYPDDDTALKYVANGEIGVVVGMFRRSSTGPAPKKLRVEFASQPGIAYGYWQNEFGGQEGPPPLELAYAITVHKAQGSEFGRSLVVIPNPCLMLSRELLYTAFTRQQHRLVILHQGDLSALKDVATASRSETARRLTNLFVAPSPIDVDGAFLEEGLIHRTVRGELVRSKSEVIIANLMHERGVDYEYEQLLIGKDGSKRYPDFTVEDDETGQMYYWEHLGLMEDPVYRRRWEEKIDWYRREGILPEREGGGPNGVLVTTADDSKGGIDSQEVVRVVETIRR